MLNLRDAKRLQLIDDRLQDGSLAQQQLVGQRCGIDGVSAGSFSPLHLTLNAERGVALSIAGRRAVSVGRPPWYVMRI